VKRLNVRRLLVNLVTGASLSVLVLLPIAALLPITDVYGQDSLMNMMVKEIRTEKSEDKSFMVK